MEFVEDIKDNKDSKGNKDKNILLAENISTRSPYCGLIIIDNFYNNAMETRDYILTQEFKVRGKIIEFPMPDETNVDDNNIYNGAFQYTTSRDRSWIHVDGFNNWAGVLYMTPDAPVSAGTGFYRYKDGTTYEADLKIMDNKEEIDAFCQDMTKWEQVDKVGNLFNRLVLFNSKRYHMSLDYFGNSKENGRLFQVFFFSTEK